MARLPFVENSHQEKLSLRIRSAPGSRKALSIVLMLLAPVFLGVSTQAFASADADQKPLKDMSLEELANVEVTSVSRVPQRASQTAAAIFVITNDDIRRSGATNIPEALRLAPGVEVARLDSDKWSVGIRGFGSRLTRNVLVLIDGRTVYTTLLAGTYWEVQNLILEDVDRIEVIRGPGGTIWGPNSFNGVINIITKPAAETQGTLVKAGGGTVNQGVADVRYGGSAREGRLNYRIFGKWFTRGHEYHVDGRNYDDSRAGHGGFRMDWQLNDKDVFTVQGDIYKMIFGEAVTAISYTPPFSQVLDQNAHLSGGNVFARWTRTFESGSDIQLQAFYARDNRHEPNFADIRDTYDVDYIQHWQSRWRQLFTWGLGARFSHGNNPIIVSGLQFLPIQRTDRLLTAFVQDEISLVEHKLTLTVGSKFLNTNYAHFEAEPSARLLWSPVNGLSFWTAVTRAVRTPSSAEKNFYLSGYIGESNGMPFFGRFNPNPGFVPEKLTGYEVGVREVLGRKFTIDIATFYNHYRDLFSQDLAGGIFTENSPGPTHLVIPVQFANSLYGNTRGVEVAPEFKPLSFWRLRGTYSYLSMSLGKDPGSQELGSAPIIAGQSPQHQATITSSWDFGSRFSLDLDYRYVSALTSVNIPAYHTGDARFAWRPTKGLEFAIVGRNLLQPYHFEFASDPGPAVGIKRSGFVQVTWTR